jgi:hypothetical protein
MRNFFDQFDETTSTGGSSQKPSVNFFDQYDTPSVGQSKSPQEATDAMSVPDKFTRAGIKSLTSTASGLTNLAGKAIDGADPQKLAKLQQLISAVEERMGVDASQYAPASDITGDSSKPIMERLANVPRSVVEMSAAPLVGLAAGGIPGAVSLTTASTAGPTIDRKREALGLRPDQDLPNKAKFEVGAKLGLDAALLAAGGQVTKGLLGPVEEAGIRGLAETSKRGLMATGADAAFGAQASAADKLLIEDKLPTASDITVGAAQGGLPGLVAHSPGIATKVPGAVGEAGAAAGRAVRDPVVNRTFRPLESLEPQSRGRAADLIQKFSGNMDAAEDILKKDITRASKGLDDVIKEKIDEVKTAYDRKVPINPEWIDAIKEADPITGRAVEDLTTFAAMRDLKDNALYTKVKDINPLTNFKSRITDYAIGHLFSPTLAKAIAAGETAIAGAAYGVDKFTGLSDPAKVIMDKYAGTAEPAQTIAQARAAAKAQAFAQNDFRKVAELHNAQLEKTEALSDKQSLDSKEQLRAIADREAKAESSELWKTALESLRARRNSDQIKANDLEAKVSSFQDKAIESLDRLDKTVASEQLSKDAAMARQASLMRNSQAVEEARLKAEQKAKDQALTRQATLMRNSQATEQARQDALLQDVPRQLKLRENSESASSSPTALALAVAKLNRSAMENAEPQGPTAPPTSTPVSARPELVKTNMKLEEIKRKAEAKRQKDADKQNKVAAKAKAAKRVKDAEAKVEEKTIEADPNTIVFKYRGQKIIKDKDSVANPKAYREKFVKFTDKRLDVLDKAKGFTKNKEVHNLLNQLAEDWTQSTNDPTQAYNHMIRIADKEKVPENIRQYLKDNWYKVEGTWATVDKNDK